MAGSRRCEWSYLAASPFFVVSILDDHRQRRAGCPPVHDTAHYFDCVLLNFHARSGAVPTLATGQLVIDNLLCYWQSCGQTFQDYYEARAMRFACG
jgi:hypothetical protein